MHQKEHEQPFERVNQFKDKVSYKSLNSMIVYSKNYLLEPGSYCREPGSYGREFLWPRVVAEYVQFIS